MPPKAEKTPKAQEDSLKNLLGSLLKGYSDDHYNFIEGRKTLVSTGSLILDQYVKITQGIHRFVGYSQSGKTSESLLVLKNFLEKYPKSKGFYIKAEGRLGDNIRQRSGVKFVFDNDSWENGTCFVLESNIFESICDILSSLVKKCADQDVRLFIIIDSVDALRLKSDESREYGAEKVAGPQAIMKRFLAKMSIPLDKYGAVCIAISQVTSSIKIDPYSKEPPRMVSGSGGWGLTHFANQIIQYEPVYSGDQILEDDKAKPNPITNKILGHWVTVTLVKSDSENQNIKLKYPIRHERKDGNSIWREYEIIGVMSMFDLLKKKGAWFSFDPSFKEELEKNGASEIPDLFHGENEVFTWLENNKVVCDYIYDKFQKALIS
jgi:RecA/RadA recombinase